MNIKEKLACKVKNTDGKETPFDPKVIYESIIKETRVIPIISKIITIRIWRKIIARKNSYLTGPEIREMVCNQFVELGIPEYRLLYTRIGLPIYELLNLLRTNSIEQVKEKLYKHVIEEHKAVEELKTNEFFFKLKNKKNLFKQLMVNLTNKELLIVLETKNSITSSIKKELRAELERREKSSPVNIDRNL